MTNEEAKQEAIKKAYGKHPFAQRAIYLMDKNGCIEHQYSDNEMNLYSELFESNGYGRFRIKELSSIETNNGWIRIHPNGSNLPTDKQHTPYKVIDTDGNIVDYFFNYFGTDDFKKYWLKNFTHYKPITPDLKPIY